MKRVLATTSAIAFSLALPLQAAAQQAGPPLLNGETATAYAARVNACGGAPLLGAEFDAGGDLVRARCASAGLEMGPGPAAAAAAGVGAVVLIALAGNSSSTTSSTN